MDFETRMLELNDELIQAYDVMDMQQEIFDRVVERTGNFREGYYSSKRFRDLGRSAVKNMQISQSNIDGPDDVIRMMETIVQDIRNIAATIETETERIDD